MHEEAEPVFDVKWIRENAATFDDGLKRRGLEAQSARILELDDKRRALLTTLQEAQSRRNGLSKDIGKAKAAKDEAAAQNLMAEVAALKDTIAKGEQDERALDAEMRDVLSVIPNTPRADVPLGSDEKGNVEQRKVGTPATFDFAPKQHFEIGEALGLMDFEAAQKISGARFVVLKGALARLERALGSFMLDLHTGDFGYTEVNPPILVRQPAMFGTAQLPKFQEEQFWGVAGTQFYERGADEPADPVAAAQEAREALLANAFGLIPTAEVPLTNLVREQIVDEAKLPMRLTAWTPCFRSEAGAAGRDTRGMIRQHQFSKVELVSIVAPDAAQDEHERMTSCAEEVLKRLGLPFRTMLLCTGDMGFASQKTYDIEVWLPGQNAYREISSCSVCGDFQARRMDARFRPKDGGKPVFVHTLNGSGLAVGRTLIAVLENYQQSDGSVIIPDVLRPYMGGLAKIQKG
jgi:seryl-tRNA synthetase